MRTKAYKAFEKYTSDGLAPTIEILIERREELRQLIVSTREPIELARLQGRAEEVDLLLKFLQSN